MTPTELSDRLWCFAARIGKLVDALPDTRKIGLHSKGQAQNSCAQDRLNDQCPILNSQ